MGVMLKADRLTGSLRPFAKSHNGGSALVNVYGSIIRRREHLEQGGWRASGTGAQTIRLLFKEPQRLTRILLIFDEHDVARTQEFVLRWSPEAGAPYREIVRQQWNFSPSNTVRELEDYRVELSNVSVLELILSPDIGQARAVASRTQLPIG